MAPQCKAEYWFFRLLLLPSRLTAEHVPSVAVTERRPRGYVVNSSMACAVSRGVKSGLAKYSIYDDLTVGSGSINVNRIDTGGRCDH